MADPNNIRKMNIETDRGQVKKIWVKGTEETAPPLESGEPWETKFPNVIKEAENIENQKYVYVEDGKVKGFIIAGVLNGSPYLYELFVDEDEQGKGIGTILLDKIRKIYRYLISHVYESNHYLEFYKKRGFEVVDGHPCPDTGEFKLKIRW